jgi:hypothetical protein
MKKIYLLPLLFLFTQLHGQSYRSPYWSIGVNPLGVIEPMSVIGPCFSYHVLPRIELWGEISYLFKNLYLTNELKNMRGYRFIFQPRYYTDNSKTIFIAPEFRLKQYSYNASATFINSTTADTLTNFPYRGSQVLAGGAFILGGQIVLSKQNHLYLEITAGIGGKQRYIKRKNVPAGYTYEVQNGGFGFNPHYDRNNDGTPYIPLGFRLIWKLNQ